MNHDIIPEIHKTDEEWRKTLSPESYHVLREAGTERPFTGPLTDEHRVGTYSCGACGADIFTSGAKFESHCGWPSFAHPNELEHVRLIEDQSHGMARVEVRCKRCDSHLGHVFDDGPSPLGSRYCINSLSMTFRPT